MEFLFGKLPGFEIHENGTRDVLSRASFREEGGVGVVDLSRILTVAVHRAVHSDAVLQAVELPARIAHLDTGLANMNRNNLTHFSNI